MSVIPVFRWQRQEGCHKFEDSLVYMMSLYIVKILPKQNKTQKISTCELLESTVRTLKGEMAFLAVGYFG